MAEGKSPKRDSMVRSTSINFSPGEGRSVPNAGNRPKICFYFQSGTCRFANRCRFSHVLSTVSPASSVQYGGRSLGPPVQLPAYAGMQRNAESNENFNNNQTRGKSTNPLNWADAPVFVPRGPLSYANALKINSPMYNQPITLELCPNFVIGQCNMHDMCPFVHGDECEVCGLAILNPHDEAQTKEHIDACVKEMEQDMELSFAIQHSIGKSCGICLDVIMEKLPPQERRFGILDNCNHVFCLSCIRRWRSQKTTVQEHNTDATLNPVVTRSCPACRVSSDFIVPSRYWVETQEEKDKLISGYKHALSMKHCKYFNRGADKCPFGGRCFYLHELPNGTKVDLPNPERRRRQNHAGEMDLMDNITLWEFFEFRQDGLLEDNAYALPYSDTDSENSDGLEWNLLNDTPQPDDSL